MKAKLIIAAGVLVALVASFSVSAQTLGESPVKILPTNEKGIMKLVFAFKAQEAVMVKFYNEERTFYTDRIAGEDVSNGFNRRYDLRDVRTDEFWIEVSSPELTAVYKLIAAGDGVSYKPIAESTTYFHTLVADNH